MSPTKRGRKIQSSLGKEIPDGSGGSFAQVIADALHRDFGKTHAAVKIVVGLTNANERAVKNWFMGKNGPSGKHLVDLVRGSDEVLKAVLILAGRHELVVAKKLADSRRALIKMLELIGELEGLPASDARDVIFAAFCSAFVKYPKKDDPEPGNHWIEPAQSAHLTRAVMLELEANGFEIVRIS